MKYEKMIEEIVEKIGGRDNITASTTVRHGCAFN